MKRAKVMPGAMVSYGKNVFFSGLWGNTFYSLDIVTGEARIIGQIEDESYINKDLFTDLVIGEDLIFFIPHNSINLVIFDLIKKTYHSIPLPSNIHINSGAFKTAIYDQKRKELILLGYCVPQIYIFSLINKSFVEIKVPSKVGLYTAAIVNDDEVIIVSKASPEIYIIDRNKNTIKTVMPSISEKGYIDIFKCDEDIIVVSYDSHKMYKINDTVGTFVEGFESDFTLWPYMGGTLGDDGKYYYFLPFGKMCIFNYQTRSFKYVDIGELTNIKGGAGRPFFVGDKVITWFYEKSKLVKYDCNKGDFNVLDIWTVDIPQIKFDKNDGEIIQETEINNLDIFIEAVGKM